MPAIKIRIRRFVYVLNGLKQRQEKEDRYHLQKSLIPSRALLSLEGRRLLKHSQIRRVGLTGLTGRGLMAYDWPYGDYCLCFLPLHWVFCVPFPFL